jgi:hypothetical protein
MSCHTFWTNETIHPVLYCISQQLYGMQKTAKLPKLTLALDILLLLLFFPSLIKGEQSRRRLSVTWFLVVLSLFREVIYSCVNLGILYPVEKLLYRIFLQTCAREVGKDFKSNFNLVTLTPPTPHSFSTQIMLFAWIFTCLPTAAVQAIQLKLLHYSFR